MTDLAQLAWLVNLGCIDLNPHPVRADDLDHPDELRVDLDPGPGVGFDRVREAAGLVREVLADFGLSRRRPSPPPSPRTAWAWCSLAFGPRAAPRGQKPPGMNGAVRT